MPGTRYFPGDVQLQSMAIESKGGAHEEYTVLHALRGSLENHAAVGDGLKVRGLTVEREERDFKQVLAADGTEAIKDSEYPRLQMLTTGMALEETRYHALLFAGRRMLEPRTPDSPRLGLGAPFRLLTIPLPDIHDEVRDAASVDVCVDSGRGQPR